MNAQLERKVETREHGECLIEARDLYISNGALAVRLVSAQDGEPIATLSANFDGAEKLPSDCFYLKDWSENMNISVDVIDSGWIKPRDDLPSVKSGFIVADAFELLDVPLTQAEIDEYYA